VTSSLLVPFLFLTVSPEEYPSLSPSIFPFLVQCYNQHTELINGVL
jgi:hypothetical protein